MQLTLLGTGCPSVDYIRFGPSNLINSNKSLILIDCGSGVTQRIKQANFLPRNIDALFLTHLHSDHVIDLYQLVISSWHAYRIKPWIIYGPRGTKEFVKSTMKLWKKERELRINYEKRPSVKAFDIKVKEFGKYGKIKVKDITSLHEKILLQAFEGKNKVFIMVISSKFLRGQGSNEHSSVFSFSESESLLSSSTSSLNIPSSFIGSFL